MKNLYGSLFLALSQVPAVRRQFEFINCKFCGVQEFPGHEPIRLWTVLEWRDISLPVGSTLAEQTILAAGFVPATFPVRKDRRAPGRLRAPVKTKSRKGIPKKSRKGKTKNERKNRN